MVTKAKTRRTFKVQFVIGDDAYLVSPLQAHPDVALAAFRFKKLTGDQAVYDVRVTQFGPECECMGFLAHRHCKHCETLAAASKLFNLGGMP